MIILGRFNKDAYDQMIKSKKVKINYYYLIIYNYINIILHIIIII